MEKRLLLAFVLSAVIFALWSVLFPPERPTPAVDGAPRVEERSQPTAPQEVEEPITVDSATDESSEVVVSDEVIVGEIEEVLRFSNDVMSVEISTRGAAITSMQLTDYTEDNGDTLELVQEVDHPDRTFPLQLVTSDGADQRLYAVERGANGAVFRWSDGLGNAVEKTIGLPDSGYGLEVSMDLGGAMRSANLSVGTGLRNLSEVEQNNRLAVWGDVVVLADGEYEVVKQRKAKQSQVMVPQVTTYSGFQDTYFLSLFRPTTRIDGLEVNVLQFMVPDEDGEVEERRVLQLLMDPAEGLIEGQLLGAPKEYDLLQQIDSGVERTLNFGFFGPISVIFLKALRWIYGVVGNYGVAIILLTVAIRILLFPLMHTSTVSMRRMQKLQPKVKEIQGQYKKKKADPQARAKMNQEMMALYKQEGVNPMGGCLPMLVQLPILWALYKLFMVAIELRHAPFFGWIQDLSAKDPYYITPILMTATMWLQQKLAPQVGDPQQQRMMRMLPFVFGFMFLNFPSGLVLYWLTNNVLTIVQQEVTFRLLGERKSGGSKGKGGGKKK